MSHRTSLPQLEGDLFLTDGGIETTLIFHQGLDLPEFAAFVLLDDDEGLDQLRGYYEPYLALARESGAGFVLESPTWRANPIWAERIGVSPEKLAELNRRAIALMEELRDGAGTDAPVVISGCIGPQDDGYRPAETMSADAAREYHSTQIGTFADTAADMVTAITMTYPDEAIGVARAAQDAGLPSAISFTVETDGRLPNGQALGDAIEEVDGATGGAPAYYMINCAHPTHFEAVLPDGRGVAAADPRPAGQRVHDEPRRAGRGRGAGRRRPGRPRRALRRPPGAAPAAERARRLLRDRSPPRRGDLRRLAARLNGSWPG